MSMPHSASLEKQRVNEALAQVVFRKVLIPLCPGGDRLEPLPGREPGRPSPGSLETISKDESPLGAPLYGDSMAYQGPEPAKGRIPGGVAVCRLGFGRRFTPVRPEQSGRRLGVGAELDRRRWRHRISGTVRAGVVALTKCPRSRARTEPGAAYRRDGARGGRGHAAARRRAPGENPVHGCRKRRGAPEARPQQRRTPCSDARAVHLGPDPLAFALPITIGSFAPVSILASGDRWSRSPGTDPGRRQHLPSRS